MSLSTVEKKDKGENLENNQRKKTLSKGTMIWMPVTFSSEAMSQEDYKGLK